MDALVKDKDWKLTISNSHDANLVYETLEGLAIRGGQNKGVKRKYNDFSANHYEEESDSEWKEENGTWFVYFLIPVFYFIGLDITAVFHHIISSMYDFL